MTTIHIKATPDTNDRIMSHLMTILINEGFETERYLGIACKIIMAKKELKEKNGN